jgi:hypothetical protein
VLDIGRGADIFLLVLNVMKKSSGRTSRIFCFAALCVLGWAMSCLVGGCSSAPSTGVSNPLAISCEPNALWQTSQAELKERGFRLDRVDRRSGVIDTFATTSGQWYEFWRRDVVGSEASAESSLQTVRRTVTVRMECGDNKECRLSCSVMVERLSVPGAVVSGNIKAQNIFRGAAGAMPSLHPTEEREAERWIPEGSDLALEADILARIQERVRKG